MYNVFYINDTELKYITINKNNILNELVSDMKDRELNILDISRYYTISTLITKKKSLILKLDSIRAIIKSTEVYIFEENDGNAKKFSEYLLNIILNNSNSNETTFELKVLDTMFLYICKLFENKLKKIIPQVLEIIGIRFEILNINKVNINSLANIQNDLIKFKIKVDDIYKVLLELISSDEDMININLSRKNNDISNHHDVEILLENYEDYLKEILNEINGILKEIEIYQSSVSLKLADNRNKLAVLSIKIGLFSISLSFGSIITGIFGMNLKSKLENSNNAFIITILIIIFLIVIIGYLLNNYWLQLVH